MFKPTKPQHITNKAYVDANSGGGGGTAEGIVVEFELFTNPERIYDTRYISKTKIASAIAAFKAGGVVLFHIPNSEYADEAYISIVYYFPNTTYYDGEVEKETERLAALYYSGSERVGELQFTESYVDDNGYYNLPIYID